MDEPQEEPGPVAPGGEEAPRAGSDSADRSDPDSRGEPLREPAIGPSEPGGPGEPGEPYEPVGRGLVRLAGWFYGALLAAALVWGHLAGRPLLHADAALGQARLDPVRDLLAGLLSAAVVILISDRITKRTRWGEDLARELGAVLGRPSGWQCLSLALMSGVAEEAFFRGALQPAVGLVGASLLFGLAHFVPRRELLPWTGFSVAAGLLLGILYDATGNLLAPVVAHVVINAVNLRVLTRRYGTQHARPSR